MVPGDNSFGNNIDSNGESRGDKVAPWFSNDVDALFREILVQGHVDYLGNLEMKAVQCTPPTVFTTTDFVQLSIECTSTVF